jgi:hypothetical protein
VNNIDPASIRILNITPLRSALEDVATPFEPYTGKSDPLDCLAEGSDGFVDLTLKFDNQDIIQAIESTFGPVNDNDVIVLPVEGVLNDGTPFVGEDVIVIKKKGKR